MFNYRRANGCSRVENCPTPARFSSSFIAVRDRSWVISWVGPACGKKLNSVYEFGGRTAPPRRLLDGSPDALQQ